MTDPVQRQPNRRALALTLTASGVLTIAIAIVAGAVVAPALYAIALVGVADFVIAWMFASGRLGGKARDASEAVAVAQGDPDYNPYARED